ncbi:hypothetical protein RhiirA4_493348 [Rhizophagus irregularis]|uniref:Uncharacterized protein n=1 Tax=Rhizophagus irregularis TaxID=588596 RepID=A0A2I1HXM8_9GLOM|nr:hypothetical protein RhiirA4_493348 [Rhizophagus irregularis]
MAIYGHPNWQYWSCSFQKQRRIQSDPYFSAHETVDDEQGEESLFRPDLLTELLRWREAERSLDRE